MIKRPYILTIAGFDPSGGAGLLADIKTFEALKCVGLSVISANTIQNDVEVKNCYWTPVEIMKEQIDCLFDRFEIDFVKIGIIENWIVLGEILDHLKKKNEKIKVVLDPVIRSSSSFEFHAAEGLQGQLDKLFLITPNRLELEAIGLTKETILQTTHLYLTGGHNTNDKGRDQLFLTDGRTYAFRPGSKQVWDKHGSGCILSAALTAHFAKGYPFIKACKKAKDYTEKRLGSNTGLLSYHN